MSAIPSSSTSQSIHLHARQSLSHASAHIRPLVLDKLSSTLIPSTLPLRACHPALVTTTTITARPPSTSALLPDSARRDSILDFNMHPTRPRLRLSLRLGDHFLIFFNCSGLPFDLLSLSVDCTHASDEAAAATSTATRSLPAHASIKTATSTTSTFFFAYHPNHLPLPSPLSLSSPRFQSLCLTYHSSSS